MSILTWYPAHENNAVSPTPTPENNKKVHDNNTITPSHADGPWDVSSPSPDQLPTAPPTPQAEKGDHNINGFRGRGVRDGENEGQEALQRSDPGFVKHFSGVVGLSIIPGGVISADSGGRVLLRGPDKLIGE